MLDNNSAYKYENPYKGPFVITQCLNNVMVTLQCGAMKSRYNIHHIKLHTYDTNIDDVEL